MGNRIDKINYYLDIAETVASRSTCLRKKYGTVIVNHDQIISTGYSGAPRGRKNCCDIGYCTKKKLLPDQRHGGYDACRSVHSEQNAIISAARKDMIGATLYLVGINKRNGDLFMSKRARKIFAWCMLIAMIASVAATVISYAIYS